MKVMVPASTNPDEAVPERSSAQWQDDPLPEATLLYISHKRPPWPTLFALRTCCWTSWNV